MGPALADALHQVFMHARDESLRLRGFGRRLERGWGRGRGRGGDAGV